MQVVALDPYPAPGHSKQSFVARFVHLCVCHLVSGLAIMSNAGVHITTSIHRHSNIIIILIDGRDPNILLSCARYSKRKLITCVEIS